MPLCQVRNHWLHLHLFRNLSPVYAFGLIQFENDQCELAQNQLRWPDLPEYWIGSFDKISACRLDGCWILTASLSVRPTSTRRVESRTLLPDSVATTLLVRYKLLSLEITHYQLMNLSPNIKSVIKSIEVNVWVRLNWRRSTCYVCPLANFSTAHSRAQ